MHELILGGARSGKSTLAEERARASGLAVTYVATAEARDDEMAERIAAHRARRPAAWSTIEAPRRLARTLAREAGADRLLLVDCLTLWLSNHLGEGGDADDAARELVATLAELEGPVMMVANEVGLGVVPSHPTARRFRDAAGRLNQAVAACCQRVTFVAAGCPLTLKGPAA